MSVSKQGSNNYSRDAKSAYMMLTDYFTNQEVEVPWQYSHVRDTGK